MGDLTVRAAEVLRGADLILAEDKRVTAKLLAHVGALARMQVYHDHSSEADRDAILARLSHSAVALVSDAGTPLISDPGYKLVRAARAAGLAIHTLPGPSAVIAALTLAGLPTDRFLFAGFLPPKAKARGDAIAELAALRATLVFYEGGLSARRQPCGAPQRPRRTRGRGGARNQQALRGVRHRLACRPRRAVCRCPAARRDRHRRRAPARRRRAQRR